LSLTQSKMFVDNSMLYEYQKKVIDEVDSSWLFALDTGTGKTILSIHHYLKHYNGEPLLIVAPAQKVLEGGWDREVQAVANYYGISIEYDVMSYGVLAKKWNLYKGWFVIYDECHLIKNPTSQRGKAALMLTKTSTNFSLLSATPSSNGWNDTINYMLMFNFYRNKTQFIKEHAVHETKFFGQRQIKVISDWKDQEKLKHLYQSISTKLSKDDCLDLPPLVFEDISFKVSKEYETIRKKRVLETDGGPIAYDTVMKLQHGLRFYTNQKDKLSYTEMLAESTTENIVVFYYYQAEKEELIKALGKSKKIYEVSGKMNNLPKREIWSDLKDSVTLVQYQAGAAGIELQYCNLVIMYTPTFSFQDYDQSLGRAYRNGQTKKVTVYRYITKRSVEEHVYRSLAEKKDFTESLFKEYVGVTE
jgi:SNF2 family DNA or RNA helicase